MIKYILAFAFVFAVCPQSFGQDVDCKNAAASCTAQCDQLQVQDMHGDNYSHETNFKKKCEDSCSNGLHNCQLQDSKNGCDTFYYHCAEACPWTVTDKYDDMSVRDSNSFSQCVKACGEGQKSCQAIGQSPRKRTGPFDACVEAQEACYADCGVVPWDDDQNETIVGSDYPEKCAKACFTGVAPCQTISTPAKCQEYFKQCDLACPDSITDEDGNVHSGDSIDMACHNTCEKGKDYCKSILQK